MERKFIRNIEKIQEQIMIKELFISREPNGFIAYES